MPYVKLHYGPYEAYGIIKYRPQRLHGLLKCLTQMKYEVEIVPSPHLNRLTVEMEGSIIYQCDIRHLLFNMTCEDDIVCKRVVEAIEEAASRIYAESNIPTFVSRKEGMRYLEKVKNLTTMDCFSSSVHLLFEHATHLKPNVKKADQDLSASEDRELTTENITTDNVEGEFVVDEYADWDFATSIIRSILDGISSETEANLGTVSTAIFQDTG